jgi:uncharacterized protein YdeI (YjbR/CyaY-like superfamily)
MGTKDPRIDTCISKAAPFARPILKKLRALVHKGCPGVKETIKWGMPSYEYPEGDILCGMAAFKAHCVFGFWKATLLFKDDKAGAKASAQPTTAAGKRAKLDWGAHGRDPVPARITNVKELPPDAQMLALIKRAAKLNEDGIKARRVIKKRPPLPMPKDFAAALKKSRSAAEKFQAFPPSHRREYIEWIVEAKTDDTRQRRMKTAIEWIADGKQRNWKYQRR